jgi:hypothetical protein
LNIHGRDYHFLLTVGTTRAISKLCPENNIANTGLIFEGKDTDKMIDTIAELSAAMSEGYEMRRKFIEQGYEPHPITKEEIYTLTIQELEDLQKEIMNEIGAGMETEIEAEPEKKGKKNENLKALS